MERPAPAEPPVVGNDVVDLAEAGAPSLRFLGRVLSERERASLDRGDGVEIWRLWAAKEAAFKVLARSRPRLVFAHARFVVELDAGDHGAGERAGVVRHEEGCVPVRLREHAGAVECVAGPPHAARACERIETALRDGGLGDPWGAWAPHQLPALPSVAVRRLARRVAALRLGIDAAELEVRRAATVRGGRPGPPELWHRARRLERVTLSLSHHGDFVACAVAADA